MSLAYEKIYGRPFSQNYFTFFINHEFTNFATCVIDSGLEKNQARKGR